MYDPFPDVNRIEPAGFCNFKCVFCPVGIEGGKRGLLKYADFLWIVDRLPAVPRVLVLYHGGEPLLNPAITDMIRHGRKIGVRKIIIDTNASLIKPDVNYSGLDEMRISFTGQDPKENDLIRVGSDYYRDAQKVIGLSRSKYKPQRIVIMHIGDGHIPDYLLSTFTGNGCETNIVFEGLVQKQWARKNGKPNQIKKGVNYCRNLFTTFTVMANGDVPLCNDDLMGDYIFGNVLIEDPLIIWKRMQPVRDAFRNGDYPEICRNCWILSNGFYG